MTTATQETTMTTTSATIHRQDSDCATLDADDCCTVCGVWHADPCDNCGGRGFHVDGCSASAGEDYYDRATRLAESGYAQ